MISDSDMREGGMHEDEDASVVWYLSKIPCRPLAVE